MSRDPFEALEQHYANLTQSPAPNQLAQLLRQERERRLSNRAMVLTAALVFFVSSLVLATAASYTKQTQAGQSLPFFRKHFTDLGEEGGDGI